MSLYGDEFTNEILLPRNFKATELKAKKMFNEQKAKNNVMIESIDIRLTKCYWTRCRFSTIDVIKSKKSQKYST